jgi:hypothetical protein
MFGSIYQNQDKNTQHELRLLGQTLPDVSKVVDRAIDVRHIFPYWILEKSTTPATSHFVNFVQNYYDWLYTKSGYELSASGLFHNSGMGEMIDVEYSPVGFLDKFIFSYAPGLSTHTIENQETNTSKRIRSLITNIRTNLYQKKSNEEAFRYFFSSLFGVAGSDVTISYPKTNIMRLNGGRFAEWPSEGYSTGYYELTRNLGGSFLNGDFKIQDSYWYQDFSYLIKAGIDVVDDNTGLPVYYEDLNNMLHPAGLKGFFEKGVHDYIPPDDHEGGLSHGEQTRLSNYFPYRLHYDVNMIGQTGIACVGCSGSTYEYDGPTAYIGSTWASGSSSGSFGGTTGGWTLDNVWSMIGGGAITGSWGETGHGSPTHYFPDWNTDIPAGSTFGSIYIGAFVYLYPSENSPNVGLTGCTSGAGACW